VVSAGHSTAGDIDCNSAAGMVDVASLGCAKDTNHDSPNLVVLGTSAGSLAEDWYVDGYCF